MRASRCLTAVDVTPVASASSVTPSEPDCRSNSTSAASEVSVVPLMTYSQFVLNVGLSCQHSCRLCHHIPARIFYNPMFEKCPSVGQTLQLPPWQYVTNGYSDGFHPHLP